MVNFSSFPVHILLCHVNPSFLYGPVVSVYLLISSFSNETGLKLNDFPVAIIAAPLHLGTGKAFCSWSLPLQAVITLGMG